MQNPDLVYHIPVTEITDVASFFDAIKSRVLAEEKEEGIFLRGLNEGIKIEFVHPDFGTDKPEGTYTIHVSCERFNL